MRSYWHLAPSFDVRDSETFLSEFTQSKNSALDFRQRLASLGVAAGNNNFSALRALRIKNRSRFSENKKATLLSAAWLFLFQPAAP
jgi:uncharacterized protein YciW